MDDLDLKSRQELDIPKEAYPEDYGREFTCPKDGLIWTRIAKVEGLPNICPVCSEPGISKE